jgi:hypothetical protein
VKYIYLALLLIVSSNLSFSQTGNFYQLTHSTYLGGSNFEQARDLEIDKEGNIYIAGGTSSADFPTTPGVYNRIYNGSGSETVGSWGPMMVFVSKFTPAGELIWSTYIGGPNYDRAYAIEVDDDGFVYVGGRAGVDFPTTENAYQKEFSKQTGLKNNLYGHQNGFITKLSPDGSEIIYSTYYGGDSYGFFRDIAIDDEGFVYGILNAVIKNPGGISDDSFGPEHHGGRYDMVAVKFEKDLSGVIWAGYLGGSDEDRGGPSIKVGPDKSVYVCGGTLSDDLPVTENAFQKSAGGESDLLLARIAADGKSLIYLTYFGGENDEFTETHGLYVDGEGHAYIACATKSQNLQTTPGAIKSNKSGDDLDIMMAKFSLDGSELLAASYFGSSQNDSPEGLYADKEGNFYVAGNSNSVDLPFTADAFQAKNNGGSDCLILKVNPDFSEVLFCTYLGGMDTESVRAFDVDSEGNMAISGQTLSLDFPLLNNPVQDEHASPGQWADSYFGYFKYNIIDSYAESTKGQSFDIQSTAGNGLINIYSNEELINSLEIYDLNGRSLYSEYFAGEKIVRIRTDIFSKGLLFIKVNDEFLTYPKY